MKDILAYSKFVGAIVEAHKQGDTKREKQLAQKAEENFDYYGVPDYSAKFGEGVEEPTFNEELKAAERTGTDGNKILQKCLSDAKALQTQANEYLTTTEGTKAPGRSYMRRCLNALEGNIEYLAQLSKKWQDSAVMKEDTFQEGAVVDDEKEPEIEILYTTKQPLLKQDGIKANIRFTDFSNFIDQLINNGILFMGKASKRKLQAGFKSFLIGANGEDIQEFRPNDTLTVNGAKFSLFIDKLQNKLQKVAPDTLKSNPWGIAEKWIISNNTKKHFSKGSLKSLKCKKNNNENYNNLVEDLIKILVKQG